MPERRSAEPFWLKHVWDAIRNANAQRQMADVTRIVRYLQKIDTNLTVDDAELHIRNARQDMLITALQKTPKGSKLGSQVDSYKIPVQELPYPVKDTHDWYCTDCHGAGDVICCSNCFRVFHKRCADGSKLRLLRQYGLVQLTANNSGVNVERKDDDESICNPVLGDFIARQNNGQNILDMLEPSLSSMVRNVEKQLYQLEEKSSGSSDGDVTASEDAVPTYNDDCCSICNMCLLEPSVAVSKSELNYLLQFVYNRICSWLPRNLTDVMASEEEQPEWFSEAEVNWRSCQLFYSHVNMDIVKSKLDEEKYNKLAEFKADILTIQHKVYLFHGENSQEVGASEYMVKDCTYDISEILNCPDCYKHSNEKVNNYWFCLPCRVPHKLVWAKQKGYPYWPAKVLRESIDSYDVRFFGGKYERAILQLNYVKSIEDFKPPQSGKPTAGYNKSVEELNLHLKLLDNPKLVQKYTKAKKRVAKSDASSQGGPAKKKRHSNSVSEDDEEMDDEDKSLYEIKVPRRNSSSSKSRGSGGSLGASGKSVPMPVVLVTREDLTASPSVSISSVVCSEKSLSRKSSVSISTTPVVLELVKNEEKETERRCDTSNAEVSSSTEQSTSKMHVETTFSKDNDILMPQTDRQYSESVEKTRRKLETCSDKQQLVKIALECMQAEIDRLQCEHDEKLKQQFEIHNREISETKKKQWCYNCEQDAIYHCCWNTAYCSPTCQQQHWQAEHKKVCRRKR